MGGATPKMEQQNHDFAPFTCSDGTSCSHLGPKPQRPQTIVLSAGETKKGHISTNAWWHFNAAFFMAASISASSDSPKTGAALFDADP